MNEFEPLRFGKYLILARIAVGGMAELYQAKITSVEGFEKLVAIKKILPHLTQEKNLVDMFIDEAKLAAMLTHQNVVQIYDLGSMEGTYYIAMEYIHGKDLRIILNKSKEVKQTLPPEYAIHITCRICAGLDYSHNLKDFQGNALQLIHRDISPQNILVTYEGDVKIVDFGIVKAAGRTSDTKVGLIKGKLPYMSPEQAAARKIDHRSDIFSTGILLYEMVTGKRMFEGSELEVLDLVRNAEFEPPESIVPGLPPILYDILQRSLAKDPDQRYQTCAEMLVEMEECLSDFATRPSAEALSQYMKSLFTKEIAAEASALQEADIQVPSIEEDPDAKERTKTQQVPEGTSAIAAGRAAAARRRQRIWLGAWAIAMAVIAMVLAIFFQERSTTKPSIEGPVAVVPPSKTEPSTRAAPGPTVRVSPKKGSAPGATPKSPSTATKLSPPKPTKLDQAMRALDNEQFAQAVGLFQQALAANPADRDRIGGPYARALTGRAAELLETDPTKASSNLQRAIKLDPQNAMAQFLLGKSYTSLKDYPRAIEAYKGAIDLDPRFADACFNLGFAYTVTGDYSRAEEMFRRVVALSPSYVDEAYFNLAMVQWKQGKKQQSIRNLELALTINPDNVRANKYLQRFKGESGEFQ
jgi:serine/threonine protein kinase/predicted TPR repeat methyltransferase